MERVDFYSEKKWCSNCQDYVRYLQNIHHSYCVECGSVVHLFSKDDWEKFSEHVAARKTSGKSGRRNANQRGATRRKQRNGAGKRQVS